jgi:hypothetical protein
MNQRRLQNWRGLAVKGNGAYMGMEATMRRRIVEAACVGGVLVGIAAVAAPGALAAPGGPIHPGVQTFTAGAQCTSNFVFADATSTYIGQAAHCSSTGAATDTNGCTAPSLPLGSAVTVTGASRPGTLVYNSWLAMQGGRETDPDACAYNDFALVRLDRADVAKVDPTVPRFGGPTGVGGATAGATVFSYGNSELRQGITQLSPKQGLVAQVAGNGWSRSVYTATPGLPGDSGSAVMNARGQAIGVLSTLSLAPLALSNGVGDLARELTYMRAHSTFTAVRLVNGTKPLNTNLLGAIIAG